MTDSERYIGSPQQSSSRTGRVLRQIAIGIVLAIMLAWQFSSNGLQVSDSRDFGSFQRDSEALVVGKMISERLGMAIPTQDLGVAPANLALAWVEGVPPSYDVGVSTILQGYGLLSANQSLPDLRLPLAEFSNADWARGVAASGRGIAVVAEGSGVSQYIGRFVRVGDERRLLQSVEIRGKVALLRLSAPPISQEQLAGLRELKVFGQPPSSSVLRFKPYTSQFGLQGLAFSWLHAECGVSLQSAYGIAAGSLGLVLAALVLIYARLFGPLFGVVFFITMLLSPWITNYGRNIYWVPFTWFLPACFVGIGLLATSPWLRRLALAGYSLSILLKCLCGYEFLSTVILFAAAPCAVVLVAPICPVSRKRAGYWLIGVGALGVGAFVVALLLQSPMKAPTVWQGVLTIVEQDALRRTHGDPSAFQEYTDAASSLSQSTVGVLSRYMFTWRTSLFVGIHGTVFAYMVALALLIAIVRGVSDRRDRWSHAAMFAAFVLPAISWYVLGKGHSARHYHMNYVLWYLGAVPVCVWICASAMVDAARRFVPALSEPIPPTPEPPPMGRRKGTRGAGGRKSRG